MKHLKLYEENRYERGRIDGKAKLDKVIYPIIETIKRQIKNLNKDSKFNIYTEDIFIDRLGIDEDDNDDQYLLQIESLRKPLEISNYRFNVNLEEYEVIVWIYCNSKYSYSDDEAKIERYGTPTERYDFRYRKDIEKREEFNRIVQELKKNFKLDYIRENPIGEPSLRIGYEIKDFLDMRNDLFKNINEE